jgi:hypothetical protein
MRYPEPKFKNKDGSLTAYSFACGYVQDIGNGWQLYKDGCYHLQRSNTEWLTFGSLTEARRIAKQLMKGAAIELFAKHEVF